MYTCNYCTPTEYWRSLGEGWPLARGRHDAFAVADPIGQSAAGRAVYAVFWIRGGVCYTRPMTRAQFDREFGGAQ